jgi:hypothetical protein
MSALAKDEVVPQIRTDIQSKRFMLTTMWNRHVFHGADRLPTGAKTNNTYYTTKILQPLQGAFFPQGRNPHEKRLIAHVGSRWIHKSVTTESAVETRDMVSMPGPPYSPDLAPSNFYLFHTVKEMLEHPSITDEDQLFNEVHIIMRSTPGKELERVCEAW